MKRTFVCVGGPLAGKRYEAEKDWFSTPMKQPGETWKQSPMEVNSNSVVSIVVYQETTFYTPDGGLTFWTPTGQTHMQSMEMLLDTYQQANQEKKDDAK